MFKPSGALFFKILCAGLGALVLWQAVHAIQQSNPLAGATIPPLPSLPGSTNTQTEATTPPPQPGGISATNAARGGPRAPGGDSGTNAALPAVAAARIAAGTGDVSQLSGGLTLPGRLGTNAPSNRVRTLPAGAGTNGPRSGVSALAVGKAGTNIIAIGTNAIGRVRTARAAGTNVAAAVSGAAGGATNRGVQQAMAAPGDSNGVAQAATESPPPSARKAGGGRGEHPGAGPGMPMAGGPGMAMAGGPGMPGQGPPLPPLPPAVQARLDRIVESELLAPMMRPQPVALLGIIGNDALLQAPNGQSGLVKEGDELGGIKLLKLGINRALIEEAGEQRELTLFSGLGSESLLSKPTNSPK